MVAEGSSFAVRCWDGSEFGAGGEVRRGDASIPLPDGAHAGAEALTHALAAARRPPGGERDGDGGPALLPRVAVLGLTAVGTAFAARLHSQGYRVVVYDAQPHLGRELLGVQRARTARHAAEVAIGARWSRPPLDSTSSHEESTSRREPPPVLIAAVEDEAALVALMSSVWAERKRSALGNGGSCALGGASLTLGVDKRLFLKGATLLSLTALTPGTAVAAGAAASKRGVRYLQASPGGAIGASCRAGGVWLWTAGSQEAHAAAAPVLQALCCGVTCLGASPALACSPMLVAQMEALRRSALAVAQSAAASGAALAADGAARAAHADEDVARARAEGQARLQALAGAHAQTLRAASDEAEALRSALALARGEAAAAAAAASRGLALQRSLMDALEQSQGAGLEAVGRACGLARERDEARALRAEEARRATSQLAAAAADTQAAQDALRDAERGLRGSRSEASAAVERARGAEAQLALVVTESEARLLAARAAMTAMERQLEEERARTAEAARAVESQVALLRSSAAAAVHDLRARLAAAITAAESASSAAEAADGARARAAAAEHAASLSLQQRSRHIDELEGALSECRARAASSEARTASLVLRVSALQRQVDDLLMDEARALARGDAAVAFVRDAPHAARRRMEGGAQSPRARSASRGRPAWSPGGTPAQGRSAEVSQGW